MTFWPKLFLVLLFVSCSTKSIYDLNNQACTNGSSQACVNIANYAVEKNLIDDALKFYQKACSLNNGLGCLYTAALMYVPSKSTSRFLNEDRISQYTRKGCKNSNQASCFTHKLVVHSYDEQLYVRQQMCNLGSPIDCILSFTDLKEDKKEGKKIEVKSKMVTNLLKYEKNTDKMTQYLIERCGKRDSLSCTMLGFYAERLNIKITPQKQQQYQKNRTAIRKI